MKRIIFTVVFLLCLISTSSADYLGIVTRTATRDTLAVPFVLLDSIGNPTSLASGDSVYVQIISPGGVEVYRDSMPYNDASIDGDAWEDFAGGQIYTYTERVSVLDGSSTAEGVFTVKIWAQDLTSAALITPTTHTFQMVNSTLEGSLDSAAFAQGNNAYFDTLIYNFGVWVDAGANTNTVVGVDGTPKNPVGTIAAAKTIADALGFATIYFLDGASETISETMEHYKFIGVTRSATVNLGSQDVDNSFFENMTVTGQQGGTGLIVIINSGLTNLDSLEAHARNCAIMGTISLRGGIKTNYFDKCYSSVAGNDTPSLDFNDATDSIYVNWRSYSGGLELLNMTTNHVMSYESDGQLVINANSDNGNVTVRGMVTITDNGTSMSITKDAVFSRQEADLWNWSNIDTTINVDTSLFVNFLIDRHWDEDSTGHYTSPQMAFLASQTGASSGISDADMVAIVDTTWNRVLTGGAHNVQNSSGKILRQIKGGSVIHDGTSDNTPANSANAFSLETGGGSPTTSTIDNFYNHQRLVIVGGTGEGQLVIISDYVGSNQVATVTPAFLTTPDATSIYEILPGLVHAETQGGGYEGGAVWVSSSGSAGTQLYVDGTIDNPIDDGSFANAKTVADALGITAFQIETGSEITLAATYNNYDFKGEAWHLALGGQDIGHSNIHGAEVSGTGTGSEIIQFFDCRIDSLTITPSNFFGCGFGATVDSVTASAAGTYIFRNCYSLISGTVTPKFSLGDAVANVNFGFRNYDGGMELSEIGSVGNDSVSIEGNGNLILNASNVGGELVIRGNWTLTDNSSTTTITRDAALNAEYIADQNWDATRDATLKSLVISNSAGDAVQFTSTGSDGDGLQLLGEGSGIGFRSTGGATGAGGAFLGGASSGIGLQIAAGGGNAVGLSVAGAGTGVGFGISAAAEGLSIISSGDDAVSFLSSGGNGHGFKTVGNGSGAGLFAGGGATGHGFNLNGGGTSGAGFSATGSASGGHGIVGVAVGAFNGLLASSPGGAGALLIASAGNGDGLTLTASGSGIDLNAPLYIDAIWDIISIGATVEDSTGNNTTRVQTNLAEATNDHYNGMAVLFINGNETNQARRITDYDGTNAYLIFTPALVGTPASGDSLRIIPWATVSAVATISDADMAAIGDTVWGKDTSDISAANKVGILMDAKISDAGGVASISDADMAALADTVLNRDTSDISTAGSWGIIMKDTLAYQAKALPGVADNAVTIYAIDTSGVDDTIVGVSIVINALNGSRVAGPRTTLSTNGGAASFNLATDSFVIVSNKGGYVWIIDTINVTGANTFVDSGYNVSVGAPGGANTCNVYMDVYRLDGTAAPYPEVTFTLAGTAIDTCSNLFIGNYTVTKRGNSSGRVEQDLIYSSCLQNKRYNVTVRYGDGTTKETQIIVPDAASFQVTQ